MESLWWGLGALLIGLLLGGFVAVPAIIRCEEMRYGLDAPVGWAWFTSWLALSYLFIAAILIGNHFWPMYK